MKARNREINIFNMSLLDILCGALGAFCFMMLSLFPYYHPPGEDFQKVSEEQKKMLDEVKDIKDLAERLKYTSNAEDQRELVEKLLAQIEELENKIKELQGKVNYLMAENQELKKQLEELRLEAEQLRADNQRLAQENQQLRARNEQLEGENQQLRAENQRLERENNQYKSSLQQRQPWVLAATPANSSQEIAASLHETAMKRTDGAVQPPFDPSLKYQPVWIDGEVGFRFGPSIFFLSPERAIGSTQRLYFSMISPPGQRSQTIVTSMAVGDGMEDIKLPEVELTPERPWIFVGTFTVPALHQLKFTPATPQERDAEWRKLARSEPPLSRREAEERARRRAEEARKGMPGLDAAAMQRVREFGLALSTAKSDGEKASLLDKALSASKSGSEASQIVSMFERSMSGGGAPPPPPPPTPNAKGQN